MVLLKIIVIQYCVIVYEAELCWQTKFQFKQKYVQSLYHLQVGSVKNILFCLYIIWRSDQSKTYCSVFISSEGRISQKHLVLSLYHLKVGSVKNILFCLYIIWRSDPSKTNCSVFISSEGRIRQKHIVPSWSRFTTICF